MTMNDRYAVMDRLIDLLDFREDGTWRCGRSSGDNFRYTKQATDEVSPGFPFHELTGGARAKCDCEVVFNCDDRDEDWDDDDE
jgi:hypothetical protein